MRALTALIAGLGALCVLSGAAPTATAGSTGRTASESPRPPSELPPAVGATLLPRPGGHLLSGRDRRPAATVALDFLRRNRAALGLEGVRLGALGRPRAIVSPNGTRHLAWVPRIDGIRIAGAGVRVHLARDGRVLAAHSRGVPAGPAPASEPTDRDVTARAALRRALAAAGRPGPIPGRLATADGPRRMTRFADGSRAGLVYVAEDDRLRPAWQVLSQDDGRAGAWASLVAADDGAMLDRRPLTRGLSARGRVWDARPGDPRAWVDFPDPWVSTAAALRGDYAHVFADVTEEGQPIPDGHGNGGEVPASGTGPGGGPEWDEPYTPSTDPFDPVENPTGGIGCSVAFPCTWSSTVPYSWTANLRQTTLQAFYFVNRFHDHLAADPIGFDRASGSFEADTPGGTDGDPLQVSTLVGASQNAGKPYDAVMNNARITVFPDGESPTMGLYLFGGQESRFPVVDSDSAGTASIVYHEYTHGMLGRLVTDPDGIRGLNILQAGALDEGLSDFYAMDYLEGTGGLSDDPEVAGELLPGGDVTGGRLGFRSSATDCPVGVTGADLCPEDGGYTFASMSSIYLDPDDGEPRFEYHADGEIITQTMWDLRTALIEAHGREAGIRRTRELVTEGLRLLASEPSYLELRDAILAVDRADGEPDRDLIWRVFAGRGMGFRAQGTVVSTHPRAGFPLPPAGPDDPPTDDPPTDDPPNGSDHPPIEVRPRPEVAVKLPRRSLRPLSGKRGLPIRIRSDQRITARAVLAVPAREARRRGLARRARTVRLASIRARRLGPGTRTLRLKARPALRRKLRRVRALGVRLTVRVADSEGRIASRRLGARLSRPTG